MKLSVISYQLSVISYQNIDVQYVQGQQIYLRNYRSKYNKKKTEQQNNKNEN